MSFSTEVKNELVNLPILSECCRHALAYGLLLFGRSFSNASVSFAAENRTVLGLYASCISEITGTKPEYTDRSGKMAIVSVKSVMERREILEAFGHSAGELSLRINRANLADECCFASFIRGAFLSCGTVSSPEKNYHLEFVVPFLKLSNDLFALLQELGFSPKHILRKSCHVIYFKDSENIEDLLTRMGATKSTLKLIGVKIDKDMRNHVNRRVNFETANIDRSVQAGSLQLEAIRKIDKARGLDTLPKGLKEIACMRMEHPEASLFELEELFEGRLSRSGINHRLKRLVQIAEEI
ncbi:MAG: DNA-binding protein WhiA [Clostridia bacterium]|nr:DNA-binding protein WhiA [Clostridia bacterium]